ncbi:probable E3 ubiquitin-protein ligase XERICO [Vigna unguiculata]|uniref:probable E3 ubiquitin-protein ligase XERICO n=1 Tax=Vigna unguiculata TaxID=3917 RepID=UPI0010164BA4|nr:probable E3 ubiquitin-protein ligase XERICO [Vigna unguiculata]
MGLSNFPSASEGVLPVLVINTVLSVAVLKNMFRSMLQVVGGSESQSQSDGENTEEECRESSRERRVSITQYKALRKDMGRRSVRMVECCVCLCRFEGNEEVSELPCKHYFHRGCLEKWFHNKHSSCPLCRSMD